MTDGTEGPRATADSRVVAEDAQAWLPPRAGTIREDLGDVVLRHVPISPHYWYGSATRPRFRENEADRRIAEVRGWFRAHGRDEFMWMVGDSATPHDLVARLERLGARGDEEDPVSEAMVLDHEPPPGPPDIEIRRVMTYEDFRTAMWIPLAEAGAETWANTEVNLPAAWEQARDDDQTYSFLALRGGEPIAIGQLVWLTNGLPYLGGATTLRAYRGVGAFHGLVRARWDDAVRRGVPILVVQAGRMSAPSLASIGFVSTGRVHVLRDRSTMETANPG